MWLPVLFVFIAGFTVKLGGSRRGFVRNPTFPDKQFLLSNGGDSVGDTPQGPRASHPGADEGGQFWVQRFLLVGMIPASGSASWKLFMLFALIGE